MEDIIGQMKWPSLTTPKAILHPKKVMSCIWLDWKGILCYEILLKSQTVDSNKYSSQLDQLKATLDENHPELAMEKCIIFYQDNTRLHVSLMTKQNCYLARNFWFICYIHQKSHLWISFYFYLYRSLLVEEFQFPGRL